MSKQERENLRPGRTLLVIILLGVVLVVAWCLSPIPALIAQQTAQRHLEKFSSSEVGEAEIVSEQWHEVTPFFRYRTGFGVQCTTTGGAYQLEITGGYFPLKVETAGQTPQKDENRAGVIAK